PAGRCRTAVASGCGRALPSDRVGELDGVDLGQVTDDRRPAPAFVAAGPQLATGGSEVHADRVALIDGGGLAFDGPPRSVGHAGIEPGPALPRVPCHERGGPPFGTGTGPHIG